MATHRKAPALKHRLGPQALATLGDVFQSVWADFEKAALAARLRRLELKDRVHWISDALRASLPKDYERALAVVLAAAETGRLRGLEAWPVIELVALHGLAHPTRSLDALERLTPLFSSEFAVRPFLRDHFSETFAFLLRCMQSPNPAVRRWASEGTRPRLPWGERVAALSGTPWPTLPILEALRHDPELYVRKSVANHLNDLSKTDGRRRPVGPLADGSERHGARSARTLDRAARASNAHQVGKPRSITPRRGNGGNCPACRALRGGKEARSGWRAPRVLVALTIGCRWPTRIGRRLRDPFSQGQRIGWLQSVQMAPGIDRPERDGRFDEDAFARTDDDADLSLGSAPYRRPSERPYDCRGRLVSSGAASSDFTVTVPER